MPDLSQFPLKKGVSHYDSGFTPLGTHRVPVLLFDDFLSSLDCLRSDEIEFLAVGIGDDQHRGHIVFGGKLLDVDFDDRIARLDAVALLLAQKFETVAVGIDRIDTAMDQEFDTVIH